MESRHLYGAALCGAPEYAASCTPLLSGTRACTSTRVQSHRVRSHLHACRHRLGHPGTGHQARWQQVAEAAGTRLAGQRRPAGTHACSSIPFSRRCWSLEPSPRRRARRVCRLQDNSCMSRHVASVSMRYKRRSRRGCRLPGDSCMCRRVAKVCSIVA